jgi:lysylphosphatidylglycerol synthetase-like protein (DUF2156 family)
MSGPLHRSALFLIVVLHESDSIWHWVLRRGVRPAPTSLCWALHLVVGPVSWLLVSSLYCWALWFIGLIAYPSALHLLDQPAASSIRLPFRQFARHFVNSPAVLSIGLLFCQFTRAQVKSRATPVPTVPCLHGRHGNCTVGTGMAREWHGRHGRHGSTMEIPNATFFAPIKVQEV